MAAMNETPSDRAVAAHLRHIRLEGKSARTVYDREITLNRVAKDLPVPLLDATPEHLYEWRAGLTVSDATLPCYASHVISFCPRAVNPGLHATTPAPDP